MKASDERKTHIGRKLFIHKSCELLVDTYEWWSWRRFPVHDNPSFDCKSYRRFLAIGEPTEIFCAGVLVHENTYNLSNNKYVHNQQQQPTK